VQKHLFEEECALAGAPRIVPFGPVMVAPVIMAFGSAEQQQRFLPGIASGDVWWSQGYSEPGSGSDLASLKTRAERKGDKYIVNGQKTWTTLGQYGEWIFCLVRTSTDGKPQTGISFLLIDMKSPGITVRPIIMLDGGHEVNEVWFDNVEVPAENLIGEENKGWTYAKHLLSHERTNIADVNRAKRELERLKRIAKAEGVYDDTRFRDEIAKLEVEVVALEMLVLRVLSAEKSGKNSLDIAGLLKIRGSEIQQRYSELMMLAAGPYSLPFIKEAMEAGWQGDFLAVPWSTPRWQPPSSTCARPPSTVAPTKYNATSSRRRCWVKESRTWISIFLTTRNSCATPCASGWTRATTSSAGARPPRPAVFDRAAWSELAELGLCGLYISEADGGMGMGPVEAMVTMEELGRGIVLEPLAQALIAGGVLSGYASQAVKDAWLGRVASGEALVVLAYQERLARYRIDQCSATATQAGGAWTVSGTKSLVPVGDQADAFLVPAVANGKTALLLVERSAQGVTTRGYITRTARARPK
jgi:alkylation response protein AidB-like acyl-CoA dehydrogenase